MNKTYLESKVRAAGATYSIWEFSYVHLTPVFVILMHNAMKQAVTRAINLANNILGDCHDMDYL